MKMQQEMQKLGLQAPQMQFGAPQMPMQMPMAGFQQQDQGQGQGPTYVYGPNGELIPKDQWDIFYIERRKVAVRARARQMKIRNSA